MSDRCPLERTQLSTEAGDETTFVQQGGEDTSTVALPLTSGSDSIIPSNANNPGIPESDAKTVLTRFENRKEGGKRKSRRVTGFTINKQGTHCATVVFDTMSKITQQLWNTVNGELKWSRTFHLSNSDSPISPAFSPDGGHVAFPNPQGLDLIAILPETTVERERVDLTRAFRFERVISVALATEARRMAVFRRPTTIYREEFETDNTKNYVRGSRTVLTSNHGQWTVDSVIIRQEGVVASNYSETGRNLYSLSVQDYSVYMVRKFAIGLSGPTIVFESKAAFDFAPFHSIRMHSSLSDLDPDGAIYSVGGVFEGSIRVKGQRLLGFLWHKTLDKRVVVNIRSDMLDHLYLLPGEEIILLDGIVFVVDFWNGYIFEWASGGENYVVATFPSCNRAMRAPLRFRGGRLVDLSIMTGEFEVIETQEVIYAKN